MEKYTVVRVYKDSDVGDVLYEDLTREEAQNIVQASPSEDGSMVLFNAQPKETLLWDMEF